MNEKSKKSIRNNESKRDATQLSLPISEREEAEMTVTEIVVTEITANSQTSTTPVETKGASEAVDTGKDFEDALIELEKVVNQLEGEVKLEEALQLFDRGMRLSKSCDGILKAAEQKIEILKRAADGNFTSEKFSEDSISN